MTPTVKLSIEDRNLLRKAIACAAKTVSESGGTGGGATPGLATEVTLASINSKTPTLGQKPSASSSPVVIATDQSTLPVSINSVPLPLGAATSANQNQEITILGNIDSTLSGISGEQANSSNQLVQNSLLQNISDSTKLEDSPASSGDRLMSIGGVRLDSDTSPVSSDGDYHPLVFNSTGRAKVSAKPAASVATTGSITTSTSIVAMECARETGATLVLTGTFTGVNMAFEFSIDSTNGTDGNWFSLLGSRTNTEIIELVSGVVATGLSYGWQFSLPPGSTYIRTRATAFTSGAANVTWKPGAFSSDPVARVNTLAAGTATIGSIASIGTSITPGTAASNLGKSEDAPAASGDTGIFSLGVRRDNLVIPTSASGDYSEFPVDQYGSQLVKSMEKHARTYSSSALITPASGATDIVFFPGNGTTTVYITKVIISGIATVGRLQDVQVIKRTSANTGGTSSAMSVSQHDSADATPGSTPVSYSANPTSLGTASGVVRRGYVALGRSDSTTNNVITFELGDKGRPLILRSANQGLSINLSGTTTLAGDNISINFEWYEI